MSTNHEKLIDILQQNTITAIILSYDSYHSIIKTLNEQTAANLERLQGINTSFYSLSLDIKEYLNEARAHIVRLDKTNGERMVSECFFELAQRIWILIAELDLNCHGLLSEYNQLSTPSKKDELYSTKKNIIDLDIGLSNIVNNLKSSESDFTNLGVLILNCIIIHLSLDPFLSETEK